MFFVRNYEFNLYCFILFTKSSFQLIDNFFFLKFNLSLGLIYQYRNVNLLVVDLF